MLYKPEHVVDLETGAIVAVDLQFGDHADGHGLAERVLEVEARMNVAVGDAADVKRVQVIVGDMGYCDATELSVLQAVGIRTAIADPVRNRRWEKLPVAERRALRTAQRTTRSGRRCGGGKTSASGMLFRPRVRILRCCCGTGPGSER